MEITIKEKTFNLKKTFRSLIAYEQAMGKAFAPSTVTEYLMYFYCVIIASNSDLELTYDDFIDWVDNNPTVFKEFSDWLIEQSEIESKLTKKKSVRTTKTK